MFFSRLRNSYMVVHWQLSMSCILYIINVENLLLVRLPHWQLICFILTYLF